MNELNQAVSPNEPVNWAAECGPQSQQELPAAPLERLVGQESEKTRQEGICISEEQLKKLQTILATNTGLESTELVFGPQMILDPPQENGDFIIPISSVEFSSGGQIILHRQIH